MDRRTKFILLVIGAVSLFGLVVWLIVWPTLAPLFPGKPPAQPPGLPSELTPPTVTPGTTPSAGTPPLASGGAAPGSGVVSFEPGSGVSAEAQLMLELARRAGALSERMESGSSADGFTNLDDAALDASPGLAAAFRAMKSDLQKKYPATGPTYLTIARRLTETPLESSLTGATFKVMVQLQIQVQKAGQTSTIYREATVAFTKTGDAWIASGYETKAFTP